jgi:hypothetical protein
MPLHAAWRLEHGLGDGLVMSWQEHAAEAAWAIGLNARGLSRSDADG